MFTEQSDLEPPGVVLVISIRFILTTSRSRTQNENDTQRVYYIYLFKL